MISGCGLFVKEGLRFQHRQDLSLSFKDNENEFQSCWIETINDLGPNTIIGCYYRHNPSKISRAIKSNINQNNNKKNRGKQIILCGDFNYNLLSHENGEYVGEFPNIMY